MTTKFNVSDSVAEAEKEMGTTPRSDFFKIKEGSNKIRILTIFTSYASHFKVGACLGKEECPVCIAEKDVKDEDKKNRPSVKFLCHVLDYTDNEIKLAQLPYSIAKAVQTLQEDPDYAFSEAPMPYDIKINAKGAGTTKVEYSVVPNPKAVPVSQETLDKLAKLSPPDKFKEAMQNKRKKELGLIAKTDDMEPFKHPDQEINPDDIPF